MGVTNDLAIRRRGNVVVNRCDGQIRPADAASGSAQTLKGLRRSDLVHKMQVNIEQRRLACLLTDDMRIPDFFKQGTRP
jgi:hypothetical protein